ncbi:uncharacterized protein LOC110503445 [Oncorhynchus mykiss]|uniref:uncharacterized protein LOC110503445 n=1 Tax=Oncorhynchus mykiss TaxID=8022 RepID=UPI001878CC01|nr:uncharacterized protein LOC110503445 [Oncorhynchus mykiss]
MKQVIPYLNPLGEEYPLGISHPPVCQLGRTSHINKRMDTIVPLNISGCPTCLAQLFSCSASGARAPECLCGDRTTFQKDNHLRLLLKDSVTCTDLQKQREVIHAAVGESLVLNCTYNCSSGFVRGHWVKLPDCPHCPRPRETKNVTKNGDLCTLPLYFPHLSREDFQYNYTCFSEDHESEQFPSKIECLVSLQAQARPSASDTTDTTDESMTTLGNHEDSIIDHEKFTGVKVLATVTVIVAAVSAAVAVSLCMSRNRYCKGKPAVICTGYVFFSSYNVHNIKRRIRCMLNQL